MAQQTHLAAHPAPPPWTVRQGLRYGGLSVALAFVALPLYVLLPNYYAREFGLGLSALGALLLGARVFDALIDPALGLWADRLFQRGAPALWRHAALAALLLSISFAALFLPPVRGTMLWLWAGLALLLCYGAYSFISVIYQSWGARLGGDAAFRARVAAWREAPGLLGVLLASALPLLAGYSMMVVAFTALLALGLWALSHAPAPASAAGLHQRSDAWRPWMNHRFRSLLLIFVLNGIASAIPATLILFFVQDLLQSPQNMEAVYLSVYFLAGALALPLWIKLVGRIGLAGAWLSSMLLSIAVFIWTANLGAGDIWPFLIICALSGIALGADLSFPSALLTGVIQAQGDQQNHEGAYYGWWNFAAKLNLALAAGLALPLLQAFGYSPGAQNAQAQGALVLAYCILPCALKLIAFCALLHARRQNKFESS